MGDPSVREVVRGGRTVRRVRRCRAGPCPRGTPGSRRRRSRCARRRPRRSRAGARPRRSRRRRRRTARRPSVSASATARVPPANASNSKTPIGPFQNTVLASDSASANALPGVRADVEAELVGRDRVGRDDGRRSASAVNSGATTMSVGQQDLHARTPRPAGGSSRQVSSWSSSSRLLPTSWPWALRKVNTMPPPISSRVGLAEQVVDDAELVGDLGAAEHHDVGPLGVLGEPAQHRRSRSATRPPMACGSRCATSYTEACLRCTTPKPSLTNTSASAASWSAKAPRTASSLLVSPSLNRTFSSTATWPSPSAVDGRPGASRRRCPRRTRRRRRAARRAGPRPAPGSTAGPGRPSGRPRCAVTTTRAPASASSLDGRHAGPDPAVVGDPAVLERDVEVGADQDALAAQVAQRSSSVASSGSEALADVRDQVGEAVGVAPLVVVPADDLDLVADHLGQARVEDARVRVGDDVGGHDRVLGVLQDSP